MSSQTLLVQDSREIAVSLSSRLRCRLLKKSDYTQSISPMLSRSVVELLRSSDV
jgi:hypothetical protein